MRSDSCHYEFDLDDQFFKALETSEIQKGNLKVLLDVIRDDDAFILNFQTDGHIIVTCDRCLDDMILPISSSDQLKVKLGRTFVDGEDLVVVPEEEGFIDVAWFMYEFIALNIPIKHVHEPGKCNEEMMKKYKEYLSPMKEDDFDGQPIQEEFDNKISSDNAVDPRWNELKKILDNN
ncbi:MAG: YceD family protein [Phocaeicola sp.]|uniref:YceD family protein n=1 Tax=Phocaeicola sp. TaxID=2773926 RepID=UPI003FA05BB9